VTPATLITRGTSGTTSAPAAPTTPTTPTAGRGQGHGIATTPLTVAKPQALEEAQAQPADPARAQAPTQAPALEQPQAQTQALAQALAETRPRSDPRTQTSASAASSTPALAEALPAAAIESSAALADTGGATLAGSAAAPLPSSPTLTVGTSGVPAEARLTAAPDSADFARQLGAQLTTFVRDGVEHARLHLNPAELGPVTVRIRVDGDAAQVHLAVEHPLTRQALEQSMPLLAGNLREAGLTLSGGGVFEQPRQPGDGAPQTPRGPAGDRRLGSAEPEATLHVVAGGSRRRGVVDLVA